jgi:hypothetical protein
MLGIGVDAGAVTAPSIREIGHMTKKLIVLSAFISLAAAPALAGPPTGSTALGTGTAATPWLRERARATRPYALTGARDEAERGRARTRTVVRLGNKVELDRYR